MASRSLRCIAPVKAVTCSKLIGCSFLANLTDKRRRSGLFRGRCDTELRGYPARGLLPLRRDAGQRLARAFQDCRWGRFRRAAVERRLRSVGHVKLDGLGGLLATQLGRKAKGAINPD